MFSVSSHPLGRKVARIAAHASRLSNVLEPFKRLRTTNDKLPSPSLASWIGNTRKMHVSMTGLRPRDASILGTLVTKIVNPLGSGSTPIRLSLRHHRARSGASGSNPSIADFQPNRVIKLANSRMRPWPSRAKASSPIAMHETIELPGLSNGSLRTVERMASAPAEFAKAAMVASDSSRKTHIESHGRRHLHTTTQRLSRLHSFPKPTRRRTSSGMYILSLGNEPIPNGAARQHRLSRTASENVLESSSLLKAAVNQYPKLALLPAARLSDADIGRGQLQNPPRKAPFTKTSWLPHTKSLAYPGADSSIHSAATVRNFKGSDIVVNYSPTLVVQGTANISEVEDRLIDAIGRNSYALAKILDREYAKRARTQLL